MHEHRFHDGLTGSGLGLGLAMTMGLARAGIRVVATAAPECADVTREADAERVVATALERFGRVAILVNNAGRGMRYVRETIMTEPTRFWEVEPDTWRMVIETNVNGPFLMARAVAPHLIRTG